MKIARVERHGEIVLAMPLGERWIDISHAWQDYERVVEGVDAHSLREVRELLARGLFTRAFHRRVMEFVQQQGIDDYDVGALPRFAMPLRPGKIIAIGRNYAAHVRELESAMPEEPIFFGKNADTCIGPDDAIQVKNWYGRVDHEGEIGVVIGQQVRDARPELVQAFVAGYTLLNDVTAREMQKRDIAKAQPWYRSKNLDTFCPIGPCILLREAVEWPLELELEVRVNGEVRQKSNTRRFLFGLPELIAHVSKHITLEPGDVIATGTPEGVGPIHPGDVVEVASPPIGILRNSVIEEPTSDALKPQA
ncbi:MAG: fumarylacetoacetate hydrolase family protein [Candidatus Hydrogenedentes bacterium]|nr:fumarylacetoacetate hydrolase family protein [Candidatus Hydrogenedentota bacterium]